MAHLDPLINVDWLAPRIGKNDVKVLDGTWCMPGSEESLPDGYIPGAQVFDIDEVAAPHPNLSHMLPTADMFAQACSERGLNPTDTIVCYDKHGVFSSPRLWWTFKMFGHENVYVLDGGLPAWIATGQTVSITPESQGTKTQYVTSSPLSQVVGQVEVLKAISTVQIVDARPKGRFAGTSPEPRAGLRSGRIPQSLSFPFGELRTQDGHFKPLGTLRDMVTASDIDLSQPLITTCGSGITAAGLALTFYRLGATDIRLYDGSWTEWGASDAPIESD